MVNGVQVQVINNACIKAFKLNSLSVSRARGTWEQSEIWHSFLALRMPIGSTWDAMTTDHRLITVDLCTPALLVAVNVRCAPRKPITSIIPYASPLAFSQQLISEKNPVPILRGAMVRKLRYPSPLTFNCPKIEPPVNFFLRRMNFTLL